MSPVLLQIYSVSTREVFGGTSFGRGCWVLPAASREDAIARVKEQYPPLAHYEMRAVEGSNPALVDWAKDGTP